MKSVGEALTSLVVEVNEIGDESRHDEILLLDHTLPSLPEAQGQLLLVFSLECLELGLQSLAVLLEYVTVLRVDDVLAVDHRFVFFLTDHVCR
jgi:hypothetical protein